MVLFQTKIKFLGHEISNGEIIPINRSIDFADKFPDEILDKTQLQRFLGCVNYIVDYYKNLATKAVKLVKSKVKKLPCLALVSPYSFKIVETDASDLGYGGILKQKFKDNNK